GERGCQVVAPGERRMRGSRAARARLVRIESLQGAARAGQSGVHGAAACRGVATAARRATVVVAAPQSGAERRCSSGPSANTIATDSAQWRGGFILAALTGSQARGASHEESR